MTTAIAHHFFRRRPLALALAAVLALASIGSTAAPVSISDTPIATGVASTVKPNLMFILDDSTSMSFEFISRSGDYPEWGADKVGRYAAACNRVYYDPTITYSKPPTVAGLPIGTAFGAAPLDGFNRFDVTSPRVWDQPTPSAAFAFNSGPRNGALEASLPSNPVVALGSSFPLLIQRDAAAGDYWVRFPAGFYYELTAAGLLTFDPLVDCQVPISTASPKWNLVMASSLSGTATAPNSRQTPPRIPSIP